MERTKDKRPGQYRRSLSFHIEGVPQDRDAFARRQNLKAVETIETARAGKAELCHPAGTEFFNGIAYRAVTAGCADANRAIKAHGRPHGSWPKSVVLRGERVKQNTYFCGGAWNFSLMNI